MLKIFFKKCQNLFPIFDSALYHTYCLLCRWKLMPKKSQHIELKVCTFLQLPYWYLATSSENSGLKNKKFLY